MNMNELRQPVMRIAAAALFLLGLNVEAAPVEYAGRGVFHFVSGSGCPPGGLDSAQADCNRIALDLPGAHAAVDVANHTIVFSSAITRNKEVVVGDVLLQGTGVSEEGQRVSLSLHLLVRREGNKWDLDSYVHAPVGGKFSDVALDPYQICVCEGTGTRVLLTPSGARGLFSDPAFARRLARSLVSVRANDDVDDPAATDGITIILGLGRLSTAVMQANYTTPGPATAGGIDQAFRNGDWAVQLQALSDHIPKWVVQRELFLFGLDRHPALSTVMKNGFKAHDTLEFGARGGKGFVRLNGREAAFDGAAASGHAFMQESFMGLILAWRLDRATAATARAPLLQAAPKI